VVLELLGVSGRQDERGIPVPFGKQECSVSNLCGNRQTSGISSISIYTIKLRALFQVVLMCKNISTNSIYIYIYFAGEKIKKDKEILRKSGT
jgi:hypothetical protein